MDLLRKQLHLPFKLYVFFSQAAHAICRVHVTLLALLSKLLIYFDNQVLELVESRVVDLPSLPRVCVLIYEGAPKSDKHLFDRQWDIIPAL